MIYSITYLIYSSVYIFYSTTYFIIYFCIYILFAYRTYFILYSSINLVHSGEITVLYMLFSKRYSDLIPTMNRIMNKLCSSNIIARIRFVHCFCMKFFECSGNVTLLFFFFSFFLKIVLLFIFSDAI